MVTSSQEVAKLWLEITAMLQIVRRVGACEFDPFNTFYKPAKVRDLVKAGCGKTARPVCAVDGGKPLSRRLLRPDSVEVSVMGMERRGCIVQCKLLINHKGMNQ